jgi:hypothetical protein
MMILDLHAIEKYQPFRSLSLISDIILTPQLCK